MTQETPSALVCANHPKRETQLRCNRCEKPICSGCAVLTPTGYRCKDCVRSQQKIFETAKRVDFPVAVIVGSMFSFLGSLFIGLVASLGFFGFFTILIAPTVAEIISQAVRRSTSRRRSPRLFRTAAVAVALGSLPLLAINLAVLISGKGNLFPVIWHAVYTFMVTSTFYYRLSGIRLNR